MTHSTPDISGYVLAGGRSTRMGRDKALLQLAGEPLVSHAVRKLRLLSSNVTILGNGIKLAEFAPLIPDLHDNCGPLGGLEAALTHARTEWALVMPVDMPFVPAELLRCWVGNVMEHRTVRVAMFCVDGIMQPTLCLLHRDVAPYLTKAAVESRFKLYPVLEEAANELATLQKVPPQDVLFVRDWNDREAAAFLTADERSRITSAQRAAQHLWFANLNTPAEFAEAEQYADSLGR